jgi:hypothetical protein
MRKLHTSICNLQFAIPNLQSGNFILTRCAAISAAMLLSASATTAWAGMPEFVPDESTRRLVLSDAGQLRYGAISFFLMVLLLSPLVVRWLWNSLARDFPKLPRMTYFKSLGVVVAWGLLFLVVLTMIATTREIMTPGVWEKQGLLYKIPENLTSQPTSDPKYFLERKQNIQQLKTALWHYAAQHQGTFPPSNQIVTIAPGFIEVPGTRKLLYDYVEGQTVQVDNAPHILIYEYESYVKESKLDELFVLRTNGEISILPWDNIRKELQEAKP